MPKESQLVNINTARMEETLVSHKKIPNTTVQKKSGKSTKRSQSTKKGLIKSTGKSKSRSTDRLLKFNQTYSGNGVQLKKEIVQPSKNVGVYRSQPKLKRGKAKATQTNYDTIMLESVPNFADNHMLIGIPDPSRIYSNLAKEQTLLGKRSVSRSSNNRYNSQSSSKSVSISSLKRSGSAKRDRQNENAQIGSPL